MLKSKEIALQEVEALQQLKKRMIKLGILIEETYNIPAIMKKRNTKLDFIQNNLDTSMLKKK